MRADEHEEGEAGSSAASAVVPGVTMSPERGAVLREVFLLYLGTLLAIKGVVALQIALKLPADILVLVPLLFLYVPVLWLRRLRLDPDHFGLTVDLADFGPALKLVLGILVVIVPPFLVGNHYFQRLMVHPWPGGVLPKSYLTQVVAYHLLFVGPPEEFFYRGYMQSRLNQVFPRTVRVLGTPVGWGLVLTALLFAAGHSIVVLRWWHFAIFFPALAFGWLRERTGTVLAPALFHAACNIMMVTLDTWYGVIPP